MSPTSDAHDSAHAERVFLHALHALPASDVPSVEAQIAACADCRQEMATLRPTIESFVAWPTDVVRPSPLLWERLTERIASKMNEAPDERAPEPWEEPEWKEVAPGIACKLLATDTEKNRISMLVRLAPGTEYPAHRHDGFEEVHMLDGELIVDDQTLRPGDYRRAEAGTADHRVWSETGCTCVLVTSVGDVLL